MERLLRPERFDIDPNAANATDAWEHWFLTFSNFLDTINSLNPDKLKTLIHFLSPSVYKIISRSPDYDSAIRTLQSLYVQPKNEIFSRHLLATSKQNDDETLDQFMQKLRNLAKDCNFKDVTAERYQEEAIRDAFISGLKSPAIRQRLLEHKTLDVGTAFDQAKALDFAQQQSSSFSQHVLNSYGAAVVNPASAKSDQAPDHVDATLSVTRSSCFFCGYDRHPRSKCPARDAECKSCGKRGHFQKVCRSMNKTKHTASVASFLTSAITTAAAPSSLTKAITEIFVNGVPVQALVDTGSSESYISDKIVHSNNWEVHESTNEIVLASTSMLSKTEGHCFVSLSLIKITFTIM